MFGMYGIALLAALAAGCALYQARVRRAGLSAAIVPAAAALCPLLGALCGRAYLHLAKYTVNGMGLWGYTPLSSRPYEYAACGVMLGVMLGMLLAARLTKQPVAAAADALAPAGMLALAVARAGEFFSDFGWGPVLEGTGWRFFPFAVQDMYGSWHAAVFMLECMMAAGMCVYALRMRPERDGDRFLCTLLWWAATQVLCESMRAETLRWGFVRVQQLQCAVFMLGVMAVFARRLSGEDRRRRTLRASVVFVLGVGAVVFVEYALDKIDVIPLAVCYGFMAASLAFMACTIDRLRAR